MYRDYWDKLLFHYKLIHSKSFKNVYSDIPYFMKPKIYEEFIETAKHINNIALRVQNGINSEFSDFKKYIPKFNYMEEIISLTREPIPVFWSRFDGFIRAENKDKRIFYSELNYDKPCAERECMVAEETLKHNNVNNGFYNKIIGNFYDIKDKYYGSKNINVAFLVDPAHYEEAHLALLFQEQLYRDDIKIIITGAENIYVDNDETFCFDNKIDIILRLYPTEYLYEIKDIRKLLTLFNDNKILILNDPRVIISQCKSLYSYLWKLVDNKDTRLNEKEREVIIKTLPYTEELTNFNIEKAIKYKNDFVIKPIYGRYSEDVFIGSLHSEIEWEQSIEYIKNEMSIKPFILQEFCKQKRELSYYYDGNFRRSTKGYGNYGVFLSNDEVIGMCVRWNPDYLTVDDYTWFTPIGVKEEVFKEKDTDLYIEDIEIKIVIDGEFTGIYSHDKPYIKTSLAILEEEKFDELKYASEKLLKIFKKTRNHLLDNINLYEDILSINGLGQLMKKELSSELSFIGRMDWILDIHDNWKVLEINGETPAGICEAVYVEEIILKECDIDEGFERINKDLKRKIISQGKRLVESYDVDNPTIAFVALTYYEDWVNTNALYRIFKETCEYSCIYGNIEDLVIEDDKVYLYGTKVDIIFRYYPLDWFIKEDHSNLKDLIKLVNDKVFFLNPINTIIMQSKSFFPIIYALIERDFYTIEERGLIKKYIPFTTFDFNELKSNEFLIKPILGREGKKITLSHDLEKIPDEDIIFQERVFQKGNEDGEFVVIGTYFTGDEFAGVYTRIGGEVTSKDCTFITLMKGIKD